MRNMDLTREALIDRTLALCRILVNFWHGRVKGMQRHRAECTATENTLNLRYCITRDLDSLLLPDILNVSVVSLQDERRLLTRHVLRHGHRELFQ